MKFYRILLNSFFSSLAAVAVVLILFCPNQAKATTFDIDPVFNDPRIGAMGVFEILGVEYFLDAESPETNLNFILFNNGTPEIPHTPVQEPKYTPADDRLELIGDIAYFSDQGEKGVLSFEFTFAEGSLMQQTLDYYSRGHIYGKHVDGSEGSITVPGLGTFDFVDTNNHSSGNYSIATQFFDIVELFGPLPPEAYNHVGALSLLWASFEGIGIKGDLSFIFPKLYPLIGAPSTPNVPTPEPATIFMLILSLLFFVQVKKQKILVKIP